MGQGICGCNKTISINDERLIFEVSRNNSKVYRDNKELSITSRNKDQENKEDKVILSIKEQSYYENYKQNMNINMLNGNNEGNLYSKYQFYLIIKLQRIIRVYIKRKPKVKFLLNKFKMKNQSDNSNKIVSKNIITIDNNKSFGVIQYDNKKYTGYLKVIDKDILFNEEGIFLFNNGDYFYGEFDNNKPFGYGNYSNLQFNYEGEWNNSLPCGYGIEIWNEGSYFQGYYNNGYKNDIGTYTWPNGSIYIGEITDNQLNGYGLYKFFDGRIYFGEWRSNSMHGYGEFYWIDGKKYIGFFENDEKTGFGMHLWKNPIRIYIGFWKEGKQNGYGRYISEKISIYGIWNKGIKQKVLEEKEFKSIIKKNQQLRPYESIFSMNLSSLEDIFEGANF